MSTYWSTNAITATTMARLGPYIDGFVGTDGEYQDLYAAVMTGGWKRIIVTPGCTMSANLTLSASDGFIVSFDYYWAVTINSNSKRLTVSGDRWMLKGFKINTPSGGDGLVVTGTDIVMDGIGIISGSARGIFLNGGDNHVITMCKIQSNGDDGVEISSGVDRCRIHRNHINGNGAWGIDDNSGSMIEGGNYLGGNTSGGRSTSSTYVDGKSYT